MPPWHTSDFSSIERKRPRPMGLLFLYSPFFNSSRVTRKRIEREFRRDPDESVSFRGGPREQSARFQPGGKLIGPGGRRPFADGQTNSMRPLLVDVQLSRHLVLAQRLIEKDAVLRRY